MEAPEELATQFDVEVGTPLTVLDRIRLADDEPGRAYR